GANNYYLMYGADGLGNQTNVTNVLDDAVDAGFDALRMWAFFDVQDPDEENRASSVHRGNGPTWFQAWDEQAGRPVVNEGEYGLRQLDFAIAEAGERGLKLVLPLTNNWSDFGGIDQYVRWLETAQAGTPEAREQYYHDDFYTDPQIRQWFKDWIRALLTRENTYTGVTYAEDPTIMLWELGNEPRCRGSNVYPASPGACAEGNTAPITAWADEMSTFIKSLDPNHMVSLGDEGWFCDPDDPDDGEATNCTNGVDTVAVTRLPNIDLMSMHLYPDPWGYDAAWGSEWIAAHAREARRIGKPVYLGEFGIEDKAVRNAVYRGWLDTVRRTGVDGFLYWILSSELENGTLYADYDGLTVYCPSPVCTMISVQGQRLRNERWDRSPIADHDRAVTEADTPVTIDPTANDVFWTLPLRSRATDLDPDRRGIQHEVQVSGGTFAYDHATLRVTFTPDPGFAGIASASYTVSDQARRRSDEATLQVQVKPPPGAPVTLFSFEDGTQGWVAADWQGPDAGSTTTTDSFATDGTQGLAVTSNGGAWFQGVFPEPLDLTGRTLLSYDLRTGATGTSAAIALRNGPSYNWCQSNFSWQPEDGTYHVEIDLTTALSCEGGSDPAALTQVHDMFIYFNDGAFVIDNIVLQ
ncbi:MAG TPA: cellulase family glycosylhydrolase, partial [Euzebyales bacterium]|nr:cellulase family glycosylhydrolase [Euzebyales bacterium]